MAINLNGLAMNLSEEAIKAWDVVKDKLPNIQDLDKAPERLLNLQGENADIIAALFKNSIGEAEYVCRNGRAIVQCAEEIGRVDRRVGAALLIGGAALCFGGYLYHKYNEQRIKIDIMEGRILALDAKVKVLADAVTK